MTTDDIREEERQRTEKLREAGKCAKTPGVLVGPGCTFDPDHDGRCSWGAFFEPDGSFHAMDPEGPYPETQLGEFPFINDNQED